MSMTFEQIEAEALKLPEESRARLLERLLLSFEETLDLDRDIAQAWAEEAERRNQEMDQSGIQGVPAEQVFERLRLRLK